MNEEKAKKILNKVRQEDNSLYSNSRRLIDGYLSWDVEDEKAVLDGTFTTNELEAIAWWMRNNRKG